MEVKILEERLGVTMNPLMLQDICDALNLKYMRMKKRSDDKEGDNDDSKEKEDMALATGQFKGRCNYCGQYGHKAMQCNSNPRNRKRNNGRRNGKANYIRNGNDAQPQDNWQDNQNGNNTQNYGMFNNQGNNSGRGQFNFQGRKNPGRVRFIGK